MNAAIISPEFPPKTNWGGLATFNYNLSLVLSNICKKVHILTYDGNGKDEFQVTKGNVIIHYIKFKSNSKLFNILYYKFPFGILRTILNKKFQYLLFAIDWNVFSLLYFKRLAKKENISVIHSPTYSCPSLLINLFFRHIPTIIHMHGHTELFNKYESVSMDLKILSKIENYFTNNFSNKIIACSESIKNIYLMTNKIERKKMIYSSNFVDSKSIFPINKINKNNLVYYGRIEYRKGVDILLKAFVRIAKNNERLKLYLIGEDSGMFKLKKNLVSFNDFIFTQNIPENIRKRILFIPRIDDKNSLLDVLRLVHGIVIIPSRYEPFGFAIIEPMSLGLPVAASSNGGGNEIIEDGIDGFKFKPNLGFLTKTLKKILHINKRKLLKIGLNGRRKVDDLYSLSVAIQTYKDIYRKLI